MSAQEPINERPKRNWFLLLLPLMITTLFFGVALFDLLNGRDNSYVPSALIGKSAPDFSLTALEDSGLPGFSTETIDDAPLTLINVWASWCGPCRAEHPFVERLGDDPRLKVFGLNYKDQSKSALAFLEELGNPYDAIGVDANGRVGIDFGVYGVPETFLINDKGEIVYKFVGPIDQDRFENEMMPAIEKALTEGKTS